jgi:hypothetical protein
LRGNVTARYIILRDWDRFTFDNKFVEHHPYLFFKGVMTQTQVDEYYDQHLAAGIPVNLGDLIITRPGRETRSSKLLDLVLPKVRDGYGFTVWHWRHGAADDAVPKNNLTIPTGVGDGSGNGDDINSCSDPTNLSADFGRVIWDVLHGRFLAKSTTAD